MNANERAAIDRAGVLASIRRAEARANAAGKDRNHADAISAARRAARVVTHTDPPAATVAHRAQLEADLAEWLRFFLPDSFADPWSADHLTVIRKTERAIRDGGLFAQAMPRGHGKTTMCKGAVLYAILTGRRKYVVAVAATKELALVFVDFAKRQFTGNELLAEYYPHVCRYFEAIEGKAIRARYQLRADGRETGIVYGKNVVVLPSGVSDAGASGYPSDGAVIECEGLTGAIRGKHRDDPITRKTFRPDLAILDDPQTRESAESPSQCATRESTIDGDVLGLAGPRKKIAALMPCTIIRPGDLAARFLSLRQHPEWQGEVARLVYDWPSAQATLWKQYAELYREGAAAGRGATDATAFYAEHRAEMDAGARVSWEHRVRDGELSAIQTAENLLIESGDQFFAEYQNDPKVRMHAGWVVSADNVMGQLSRIRRGTLPENCSTLVIGADVNLYGISWAACAFSELGAGYLIDYGKYPPGEEARIWTEKSGITEEQAIQRAITAAVADVMARPYVRHDGKDRAPVAAIACDASYKREAVHAALRECRGKYAGLQFMPIRAVSTMQYRPRTSDIRQGDGWHVTGWGKGNALYCNADHWRERQQKGWLLPIGAPGGSLAVFGDNGIEHRVFANQIAAEYVVDVGVSERTGAFTKWDVRPGERNDLADAVTYAMAVASLLGVRFGILDRRAARLVSVGQKPQASAEDEQGSREPSPQLARHTQRMPAPRRGGFVNAWR